MNFGVRLHLSDFTNMTGVVLILYIPLMVLAYLPLHSASSYGEEGGSFFLALGASSLVSTIAQSLIFTLVLIKAENLLRGEGEEWDWPRALSRFPTVMAVELIYYSMVLAGLVLLILPGVYFGLRYFFCSYLALFRRLPFAQYFKEAKPFARGAEGPVMSLFCLYRIFSFGLGFIVVRIMGDSLFAQVSVSAIIQVILISYYLALYTLFIDLGGARTAGVIVTPEGRLERVGGEGDPLGHGESGENKEKP